MLTSLEDFSQEATEHSRTYQIVLIVLSMLAVSWYYYRFTTHPCKTRFARFSGAASAMALWNVIQTIFSNQVLFSLSVLVQYKKILDEKQTEAPWLHSPFLHNDKVHSIINKLCLLKDLRMSFVSVISVGCFYYLTQTGIKYLQEYSNELSGKEGVQEVPQRSKNSKRILLASTGVIILLSTQFLPSSILLSSGSILYNSEWFVLRFDHIYFTMFAMFALVNCQIVMWWIRNRPNYFFSGAFMVPLGFVWSYCSFILFWALASMIFFNDTLVSISTLKLMAVDESHMSEVIQQEIYRLSTFSSFVLGYLTHSMEPNDSFMQQFATIEGILESSWIVLNTASLVVLPWLVFMVIDHRYPVRRAHLV